MRPAEDPKILDRAGSAKSRRPEVVQLDLPRAAAALPVRAAPGAAALVPLPDLAPHRRRNGLAAMDGLLRRLRRYRALPLPRWLGRALALAMLLERALDCLADHRRQVSVRDLVGEERLELFDLLLERGVDRHAQRIGVGGHRLQGGTGGRRGERGDRERTR